MWRAQRKKGAGNSLKKESGDWSTEGRGGNPSLGTTAPPLPFAARLPDAALNVLHTVSQLCGWYHNKPISQMRKVKGRAAVRPARRSQAVRNE